MSPNQLPTQLPSTSSGYPGGVSTRAQPQPKESRKAMWPRTVGMVLTFGGCAVIAGNIGDAIGTDPHQPRENAAHGPPMPGVGQEVRDGKTAFTVLDISTGPTAGTVQARGEFVIVSMTVRNTGGEPGSYFGNQSLIDASGRHFAPAATAEASINDAMAMHLNPGFEINLKVPFDVPVGTKPVVLEVHDSALSGGTRIKLN